MNVVSLCSLMYWCLFECPAWTCLIFVLVVDGRSSEVGYQNSKQRIENQHKHQLDSSPNCKKGPTDPYISDIGNRISFHELIYCILCKKKNSFCFIFCYFRCKFYDIYGTRQFRRLFQPESVLDNKENFRYWQEHIVSYWSKLFLLFFDEICNYCH